MPLSVLERESVLYKVDEKLELWVVKRLEECDLSILLVLLMSV